MGKGIPQGHDKKISRFFATFMIDGIFYAPNKYFIS